MSKHLKFLRSENIEEVFLSEALSHASAQDVVHPTDKTVLLKKGTLVGPRDVSSLAAQGIDRIFVFKKPRISILVMAEGLIPPGFPKESGKGYDFSVAALNAALETMKIRPIFVRRLKGGLKRINQIAYFALNQSDIVVLVFREFERNLHELSSFLEKIGVRSDASGRPGLPAKPIVFQKGKKQVFCLPHDSETIFECFEDLLRPSIWKFMGRTI